MGGFLFNLVDLGQDAKVQGHSIQLAINLLVSHCIIHLYILSVLQQQSLLDADLLDLYADELCRRGFAVLQTNVDLN